MRLQYLTYNEIDKAKWDTCIDKAPNGLVYAYTAYLDAMAKQWDAIVLNDYEAVMPLTWNKKYGVYYLYQPPFTASLGVFGQSISANLLINFLESIPAKFKYWDISLNHSNVFRLPAFNLYQRVNHVLSLQDSYNTIYERFRDNIKRNIKKSEQLSLVIKEDIELAPVLALAKEQVRQFAAITDKDLGNFKKIYEHLHQKEQATTYGVYTPAGELIASSVFFFSHRRAYYILVGNHPNGKTLGASHALINTFIKDHAGRDILLDFEGSDIHNLAFFYSSFGAREEKYAGLRVNRLPWLLKWMKK